jgi:hypothetical protein
VAAPACAAWPSHSTPHLGVGCISPGHGGRPQLLCAWLRGQWSHCSLWFTGAHTAIVRVCHQALCNDKRCYTTPLSGQQHPLQNQAWYSHCSTGAALQGAASWHPPGACCSAAPLTDWHAGAVHTPGRCCGVAAARAAAMPGWCQHARAHWRQANTAEQPSWCVVGMMVAASLHPLWELAARIPATGPVDHDKAKENTASSPPHTPCLSSPHTPDSNLPAWVTPWTRPATPSSPALMRRPSTCYTQQRPLVLAAALSHIAFIPSLHTTDTPAAPPHCSRVGADSDSLHAPHECFCCTPAPHEIKIHASSTLLWLKWRLCANCTPAVAGHGARPTQHSPACGAAPPPPAWWLSPGTISAHRNQGAAAAAVIITRGACGVCGPAGGMWVRPCGRPQQQQQHTHQPRLTSCMLQPYVTPPGNSTCTHTCPSHPEMSRTAEAG